jgi:hypothetical protein
MHEKCSETIPFERPRDKWDYNIKMNLNEYDMREWTGFIWFRI